MAQFERLLPQEAGIARQSVGQCQSANPLPSSPGNDGRSDQPLNTVDDLLKAADEATNLKGRTVYQYRAAVLAKEHNELDRAIKILDTMSIESREFMGGSWEDYRWEWAATSALLRFKDGDVYGMRLVLNTVPTDLQPYAKMAFVAHLPETKDKTTDPTLEFLNDARMGLRRSAVPDAEKCTWYFGLLKLTVKYLPAEATAVLKEAVAALNRAEQAKEKNQEKSKANSLDTSEISRTLPASLLEMDEYTVREAVSTISSRETRAQVRLELLGVCIQRMRMSKQAKPDAGTPGSKGE
jgi:hypothetical protein